MQFLQSRAWVDGGPQGFFQPMDLSNPVKFPAFRRAQTELETCRDQRGRILESSCIRAVGGW
ncbi:MAG: hypothetical protein L6Q74_01355 [Sphaerotilus natans subsp. sulfidivorans]|uniref:hypothetical protein n=1 Tax=Sphaerotilus sulfidivorans TaxID=639200 RepID=UPI0023538B69|nr:hypothetical protein [Sphaerotilus sulfidivorans]MCK6400553.1 hypothetical protein [Sphaerotilus sulfidivorans]